MEKFYGPQTIPFIYSKHAKKQPGHGWFPKFNEKELMAEAKEPL